MLKKKKRLPSLILLGMCALFLAREIAVTQVLCYKENGARDVELAIFSFQCQCKTDCSHTNHVQIESENVIQLSPVCLSCFDLPLNGFWLNRTTRKSAPGHSLLKQYDLSNPIVLQPEDPCKRLHEAVSLSKFLSKSLLPTVGVLLRC